MRPDLIEKYEKDIMRDLAAMIAIPSVTSNRSACSGALDFICHRAEAMGFQFKKIGDMAAHAEMGEGQEYAAVLTHVDVVPAGEGWDTDPFQLTQKNGRLYGRGISDDKAAGIIALYCMKALKDENISGVRRMRCIFGAAEETGMEDMAEYFKKEPLPAAAFTPDSEYPVCNREKGILQIEITGKNDSDQIVEFQAGSAVNCVADRATVRLQCENAQRDTALKNLPDAYRTYTRKGIFITVNGRSAHAMQPEKGKNAVAVLLDGLVGHCLGSFLDFLYGKVLKQSDGAGLGIACSDTPSGKLTINLGYVQLKDGIFRAGVDIRYPVTAKGTEILNAVVNAAGENGFSVDILSHKEPVYLPSGAPLVKLLQEAYEMVTGEKADTYSTGGGTYARALAGRGIAFGPVFPGMQPTNLHEANESIGYDELMKHARVCLAAMYRMYTQNDI